MQRAKSALDLHGTDGKGPFGEALVSMVLELERGIALTKAAWKDNPLDVSKGVDLVGIDLKALVVCFAEVKLRMARYVSQIEAYFQRVGADLNLDRLVDRFALQAGSASPRTAARELQRRLRENRIPEELMRRDPQQRGTAPGGSESHQWLPDDG